MVVSQTIPLIALAPLVIIWFGFGIAPKVVLVALFTFFAIAVGTVQGLASADPDAMNLLRTMGATRAQLLWRVRLPSALPQFFTGLKVVDHLRLRGGDLRRVRRLDPGARLLHDGRPARRFNTDLVFGAVIVTALLTLILFALVAALERVDDALAPARAGATRHGERGGAAPGGPRGLRRRIAGVGERPMPTLERVDLVAAPGEFVALIGPSGCGKSTLFPILAGLERADSGEVLSTARARRRSAPARSCPSATRCCPGGARSTTSTIGLELAGVGRARGARARAQPLLERFGLGGFESAWPWQLSGGMRQRAAFLRTVLLGKPAMLLDEPFGALDGITRAELQQWLLEVWSEFGSTVALITHDVAEAVFLADRVYVMSPLPGPDRDGHRDRPAAPADARDRGVASVRRATRRGCARRCGGGRASRRRPIPRSRPSQHAVGPAAQRRARRPGIGPH